MDYQEYYKARMDRYENDADYSNSYKSEKAIYDAIASCSELIQFKEKLGNLNELNAVALTIDEYTMRKNNYLKIKEIVRAKGPQRIAEKSPAFSNVMDLMTMIGDEENKNRIEISMDDVSFFTDSWSLLDQIEVYENGNYPSQYRNEKQQFANEAKKSIVENYHFVTEERRKWQPDWKFNFDLLWEDRHRRLIPFNDNSIKEKINAIKKLLNI